ncbi:MAG: restriction endonuclease subunit S [Clostridium sp.]|nr:restriction endonuclease subunit S [Clostridium sp.]
MITDIADGPFGSNLKTEHYTEEKEARIIQLSNLSDYGWQEDNTRYTTFEHAKEIKRCIVNEGELVMGKMMPAGMTIMRPNTEKMYILSSDCVRIKLDNNIATDKFFLYTTKSNTFLNQVNNDSQGSTRVRTSISKIRNMDISIPSVPEQEKIGEYFSNLDNLITLHQRQYYYLIINQKVWEQRKLGELYKINNERNKDLIGYDKTFSIATMTYKDEGNGAADSSLANYKVLRIGDIAFEGHTNKEFRYGRFVANDVGNGIMSPRFSTLRPVNKMPVSFWKYYIHYEPIMRKILVCSTKAGTMMNELVPSDFFTQSILVPSIEEQEKIGDYFKQIDHIITLHRRMFHTKERRTYR